jgi:type I restriction enzyme, S subunit
MARDRLYPPSVTPGIPTLGERPTNWGKTTFGDVLEIVQRPAEIRANSQYQLVTAKRSRGGIVPREVLRGRKILTKSQFFIHEGDFLISKRQIIHGACGVVPAALHGAIVSGEYAVLRPREALLLQYLSYFSHTVYFQQTCFQASVGVDVEKMIFDVDTWLNYELYLPTVSEQAEIVKRLNVWDAAIAITERTAGTVVS